MSHHPDLHKNLLDDVYAFTLAEVMHRDKYTNAAEYQQALARFCSIMGQILGAAQPLFIDALNAARHRFPDQDDHYEVELVVQHMGALLSGTIIPNSPIQLLHPSFGEFLRDQSRSGEFYVDMSKVSRQQGN